MPILPPPPGPLLVAAVELAEKTEWALFPTLGPNPAIPDGSYLDATSDPAELALLFARAPHADGFGVACEASDLVAVEVGTKNGTDGRTTLSRKGVEWAEINTPRITVPWGEQCFFRGSLPTNVDLLPGVRLWGAGSYAVVTDGAWRPNAAPWEVDPLPVPEWLSVLVKPVQETKAPPSLDSIADELFSDIPPAQLDQRLPAMSVFRDLEKTLSRQLEDVRADITRISNSTSDSRRLISPAVLFDEFLERKSVVVPCALAGLGKALGGGFETRRNHVAAAPAGGGKTALLLQSIAFAVLHGDFYGVLALKDGDQWSDGLRLAQMVGVDRFKLRDRDPESIAIARDAMERYRERMMFYDVTKPGATFTDMTERALQWVGDRGRLLVGTDSVHVFPVTDKSKEDAMPIYERIGHRLTAIHDFVVTNDAAGLTVGQSGRGTYSRKKDDENQDLLTAVSGGHVAENTIDVLIVATKPNDDGTRFLVIPKSRLCGQGSRIPVTYDEDRSLWSDVAVPVDYEEQQAAAKTAHDEAKRKATEDAERKRVEALSLWLRRHPEGDTILGIAKATGRQRAWVADTIDGLHARGLVISEEAQKVGDSGKRRTITAWKWATLTRPVSAPAIDEE